jgi:alginate O-acetyltransferase complex protein AlgI
MMTFVSMPFVLFMIVAFVAVWYANEKTVGARNVTLIVLNAIFYAFWDLRMLPLLMGGILIDYALARGMEGARSPARRKGLLALGLLNTLGLLLFFKYHGFFLQSLHDALGAIGIPVLWSGLGLIVPVGISFYSLQRAGYLLDVYRKASAAERSVVDLLAFCSFFPLILSGPIERSRTLLPQFRVKSEFDSVKIQEGLQLFLWGAFKKTVVADSLVRIIDGVFRQPSLHSGLELALGTVLFSIQLYCDFSGYSEMAMGTAQVLGFRLTRNFANPYFSRDIAEFWRRWHISLSTWLRDYVFFSLGAGYKGKIRWIANTLVTFVLCGLWHGASWNFVLWGALMGIYFVPLILVNPDPKRPKTVAKGRSLPRPGELLAMSFTFAIVSFSWIFFRSDSTAHAIVYMKQLVVGSWMSLPNFAPSIAPLPSASRAAGITVAILIVFLLEWVQRQRRFALDFTDWGDMSRWSICAGLLVLLILSSGGGSTNFIYADF